VAIGKQYRNRIMATARYPKNTPLDNFEA
jgi:hypothetical protein